MSFNIASSFGASMPVVGPVAGFQLSRDATNAMANVSLQNAANRLALANSAIDAQLELRKQKNALDAQLKQLDARGGSSGSSKGEALRTAGLALLGGGGLTQARRVAATSQAADPLMEFDAIQGYLERRRGYDERMRAGVQQGATAAAQAFSL